MFGIFFMEVWVERSFYISPSKGLKNYLQIVISSDRKIWIPWNFGKLNFDIYRSYIEELRSYKPVLRIIAFSPKGENPFRDALRTLKGQKLKIIQYLDDEASETFGRKFSRVTWAWDTIFYRQITVNVYGSRYSAFRGKDLLWT
jgi:hypothetical protein